MARGSERSVALIVVAVATIAGFVLRVVNIDQSFAADELSTYWILHGRSLGKVISLVHSDAEITPPLFFVLGWLTSQLGDSANWIRVPNLLAGTASIPLIYLLGSALAGRITGAASAVIFALNPFMIFYAVEARAYSLMIMLLILSTLALVRAAKGGRRAWWVVYAVAAAGAMLSHYTALFCLLAQFAWVLWAYPAARKSALLASAGAVVLFMPWITGFIADNNSPTTEVLSNLQPFTFGAIKFATGQWAAGYPYVPLRFAPGTTASWLYVGAAAILAAGIAWRLVATKRDRWRVLAVGTGDTGRSPKPLAPVALILVLALATPVGEAVASAVGNNLYGARNLNAGSPGLALLGGLALSLAPPAAALAGGALLLAGLTIGASKTFDPDFARTDYVGPAHFVNDHWKPGDVVLDGSVFTPVPATGLDIYLNPELPEFRLNYPRSDKPFDGTEYVPPPLRIANRAFRAARGHRLFLVRFTDVGFVRNPLVVAKDDAFQRKMLADHPSFEISRQEVWPGIPPTGVVVFSPRDPGSKPVKP